jgi:DNA-binding LacI/PurR family transcriptional regulator
MSITVIDVAKEAGVSRTTVSNVFSGRAKYSDETRAAVLAAAEKLGYKPNLAARSLITNQSRLIGLILPSYVNPNTLANNPFYNIILDSIYAVLRDEAYYDLLIFSVPYQETQAQIRDRIDTRNVDAILAVGEYEQDFLCYLESKNIPVILIDNYSQGPYANFSYINSDDEMGGYLATRRLIARGYKEIGLCALDPASPLMQRRIAGYLKAMQESDFPTRIFDQNGSPFESGMRFAEMLTAQHMDAAFCTEDMVAVGVLHRMLKLGVAVGKEFGLVGFDNILISAQVNPELTTIDQWIYEKGTAATRLILDILKKKSPRGSRVILPVDLVSRETA